LHILLTLRSIVTNKEFCFYLRDVFISLVNAFWQHLPNRARTRQNQRKSEELPVLRGWITGKLVS
jgi:hypothetical protein